MMITKKAISRRAVLRGVGAAVALPLLDGMVPALSALRRTAAKPAVRFGSVYVPNGMVMQSFTPATTGAGFEIRRPSCSRSRRTAIACSCSPGSPARRRRGFPGAATRAPPPSS